VLPVLVVACARAVSPDGALATEGDAGREPAGVFLETPAARPDARAVAPARGTVMLSPPVTHDEVEVLVHAYFRAFSTGEAGAFVPLLARGAIRVVGAGGTADLFPSLAKRITTADYSHVPFELVAAYDRANVVPFDAASHATRADAKMQADDVLVEVPVRLQYGAQGRLFGPRVMFVLRREGKSWLIAVVKEDEGPWT